MFFSNLIIYRFTRPFDVTLEQLETQLAALPFTPCASQDASKFGWVQPLGKLGSAFTHSASGQLLICAKIANDTQRQLDHREIQRALQPFTTKTVEFAL